MATKNKAGGISNEDRQFIINNASKLTAEEIAAHIRKSVKVVEREIKCHVKLPNAENNMIRWHLKKITEWKSIKDEFSNEELNYLEEKYVKYVEQMESNLTATEESQVINMIKIEILMHRNLAADKECARSIATYQKLTESILNSVGGDFALLDGDQLKSIQDAENKITSLRDSSVSRYSQYLDMQTKLNALHKELNTTRQQRADKIVDSKKTFGAYVKELLEARKQEKESRFVELLNLATVKEEKRLSRAHKYADGSYDNPMLTADILDTLDKTEDDEDDEL